MKNTETLTRFELVTRFELGADADAKREFARLLVAALDEIGVDSGDAFIVTTEEYLDELKSELEENYQEVADADEAIAGIREIVADYGRGILDREEMLRKVEHYVG